MPEPWLRPRDQACAVVAVLIGCAVLMGTWIYRGGLRGEMVEADATPRQPAHFKVNINTANAAEFELLPEIGQTLARRIVDWRDAHGPFKSCDELRRVKGIGPKTMETIRPYLLPIPAVAE